MTADRKAMLESLALFDRPEGERLREFLPHDADVNALVDEMFAPVEGPSGQRRRTA